MAFRVVTLRSFGFSSPKHRDDVKVSELGAQDVQ